MPNVQSSVHYMIGCLGRNPLSYFSVSFNFNLKMTNTPNSYFGQVKPYIQKTGVIYDLLAFGVVVIILNSSML